MAPPDVSLGFTVTAGGRGKSKAGREAQQQTGGRCGRWRRTGVTSGQHGGKVLKGNATREFGETRREEDEGEERRGGVERKRRERESSNKRRRKGLKTATYISG